MQQMNCGQCGRSYNDIDNEGVCPHAPRAKAHTQSDLGSKLSEAEAAFESELLKAAKPE